MVQVAVDEGGAPPVKVFPAAAYECVRCGTKASMEELSALPSPRCASCGFTVFRKSRSPTVKQVAAV